MRIRGTVLCGITIAIERKPSVSDLTCQKVLLDLTKVSQDLARCCTNYDFAKQIQGNFFFSMSLAGISTIVITLFRFIFRIEVHMWRT